MRINFIRLFIAAVGVIRLGGTEPSWTENPEVAALFQQAGLAGTFVLFDPAKNRLTGHDQIRARTRYIPASTFKIPHTLFGLSLGVVESVDTVLPYGGQPQPIRQWERDMSLREAIAMSNVPVFQGMARRIGLRPMAEAVSRLGYGNGTIGEAVDRFWLEGPLRISAVEQVLFLAKLAEGRLPFPTEHQAAVRDILCLESGEGWTLYGKTGWENSSDPAIGWWVGWVVHEGQLHSFALNIDIRSQGDAGKRISLGKASLRAAGFPL